MTAFLLSRKQVDVSSLSFDEQVRHFLIKNRTEELQERFATPEYRGRMRLLMEGAVNNLVGDYRVEGKSDETLDLSASLDIQFREAEPELPTREDLQKVSDSVSSLPEFVELRARQAAENEFLPLEVARKGLGKLSILLSSPPECFPEMSPEERNAALVTKNFLELQTNIFLSTIDIARQEGVLAATEPRRVRETIRSLINRESFLEMKLSGISGIGDLIEGYARTAASHAMDSDEAFQNLLKILKANGQLERIEVEGLYNSMADAVLIWGPDTDNQ